MEAADKAARDLYVVVKGAGEPKAHGQQMFAHPGSLASCRCPTNASPMGIPLKTLGVGIGYRLLTLAGRLASFEVERPPDYPGGNLRNSVEMPS